MECNVWKRQRKLFHDAQLELRHGRSRKSCVAKLAKSRHIIAAGNETTRSFRRWPSIERANYGDIKARARRLLVEQSFARESTTEMTQFVTRQSGFPSREERIVFHGKLIPTNYAYIVTFRVGWKRASLEKVLNMSVNYSRPFFQESISIC